MKLNVAFTALRRVLYIFRSLDVRADVCHGEALVLFTGTGRTFPEILFALIEREFLTAVYADIFTGSDFLPCIIILGFGQIIHQNFHSRQTYIWVVLEIPD